MSVGHVLLVPSTPPTTTILLPPLPCGSQSSKGMDSMDSSNLGSLCAQCLAVGLCICLHQLLWEVFVIMIGGTDLWIYRNIMRNQSFYWFFCIIVLWAIQPQIPGHLSCVCIGACECRFPGSTEEVVGSPGAAVIGSCELLNSVPMKGQLILFIHEPYLQACFLIFKVNILIVSTLKCSE